MTKPTFQQSFDRFIREFADRYFRVIAWTVYLSVMMTIYYKTRSTTIWVLSFFSFLVMFLYIQSYIRELGEIIAGRLGHGDKAWLTLPLIVFSGLLTLGLVAISNTVALAIVQYGK